MKRIDEEILNIDKVISKNISIFDDSERGLLSQNILAQLRNFIEHIAIKSLGQNENTYSNIQEGLKYIKSNGKLKFLSNFHNLLQPVASHYTMSDEGSERLMLKYYEYLLKIKTYLKEEYGLKVLENIYDFPINIDPITKEYHEKISQKINLHVSLDLYDDRYYIKKVKPFFVNQEIYYEVTFTRASDNTSKFDRIIAFTKLDIVSNYAVRLYIANDSIDVLGKAMPIHIIKKWEVSIRPCELDNFAKIFNKIISINVDTLEYKELMKFLTDTRFSLLDLINCQDKQYDEIKTRVLKKAESIKFFPILDTCRNIVKNNMKGANVLKYLLYIMNNKVIKKQYSYEGCNFYWENLCLKCQSIPFDQMPFNTSLYGHNPRLYDLFQCIDSTDREHELFARKIKNNTEIKAQLYSSKKDIQSIKSVDDLIQGYNSLLYSKHKEYRKIEQYKNNIYITGYERETLNIIKIIKELSLSGIKGYTNTFDVWLNNNPNIIDCDDKRLSLRSMFSDSKVSLIYGSAGTGKSTMINHISQLFNVKKKLYLANTNPAIDNLERKVTASNCKFSTIAKHLYRPSDEDYDLLFIDECSTVSNANMLEILKKTNFRLIVLVGDIFQIESIRFGNWFHVLQDFVTKKSITKLTFPYRTKNPELIELWKKVREIDNTLLEHIVKNKYSTRLDNSIFNYSEDDEIILLLNYDGLYGINNVNKFLQANNSNPAIRWDGLVYKINDPILFNETKRFGASIYNNLKGKIVDVRIIDNRIRFNIEVDKSITEMDTYQYDFNLIDSLDNGRSIIQFDVIKNGSTDADNESSDSVVPFQIAYAVSIHKAQGLEYNSVKLVISDEVEEQISHNIFYTAVTRAKEKLQIYWSPETEKKILSELTKRNIQKDINLLKIKIENND
ncbi:AAA family ATPase [Francisella philomiragia]|uniref:ATP-dependent DNA helicase n=1 Tax=Francisella philomiragia TaxID=28110 RepID=UPI001905125A|nr:ATP-dependent RecD-like DNA helicase [Francisella philomiragia]MBK2093732.1 AAA family ATPase [Francisella philomiragia]